MSIKELQAMGAFIPTKVVKREIAVKRPLTTDPDTWADEGVPEFSGETEDATITVWLKRPSSADQLELANAEKDDQTFLMLCRMVRNEDGSPLFESLDQCKQLAAWVLIPLINETKEVNGFTPKKPLTPGTPSGLKSRSPSGAEVRKNGKKP